MAKQLTPEEQAEKDSAEQQQKPLTDKQMTKQEKDFNPDDRIVQRAAYNDGQSQVTEYSEGNRGEREA